jgi:hypothetical protein
MDAKMLTKQQDITLFQSKSKVSAGIIDRYFVCAGGMKRENLTTNYEVRLGEDDRFLMVNELPLKNPAINLRRQSTIIIQRKGCLVNR